MSDRNLDFSWLKSLNNDNKEIKVPDRVSPSKSSKEITRFYYKKSKDNSKDEYKISSTSDSNILQFNTNFLKEFMTTVNSIDHVNVETNPSEIDISVSDQVSEENVDSSSESDDNTNAADFRNNIKDFKINDHAVDTNVTEAKKKGSRSSAAQLKSNAYDKPFMHTVSALSEQCNDNCSLNGDCTSSCTFAEMQKTRDEFWGNASEDAPLDSLRAQKLLKFFGEKSQKDINGNLQFRIGEKLVCECALLRILGLMNGINLAYAPSMYSRLKRGYMNGDSKKNLIKSSELRMDADKSYSVKKGHARAYINMIATEYADALPAVGDSENANTKVRVIPYQGMESFYKEYSFFCETCTPRVEPETKAGKTCFSNVFNSMKRDGLVKFLGDKHGFQTCSICNHCNSILSGGSGGRDPVTKEVTQKLKRLHMQQQHNERMNADIIMMRCQTSKDVTGQPLEMYIDIDGMTVRTGDTPVLGKKSGKATIGHHIENRNIGAHLVCGNIDTYVSFNTNDLVPGGANVIIEVAKRCIELIADRLGKQGFVCPKKLAVQYDNCGENKNKVGNAFFSLLVEEGYFEEIELFYLVVGHTHNRLDQWFSVLSKAIANSEYIGSVMALHSLYMISHQEKEKDKRPSRVEQLYCYHDWAEYLAPVINDKIKHYQVPHRTKFSRVNGKCIMQYMLFSPEYGWDPMWLPLKPHDFDEEDEDVVMESVSTSIPLSKFMIFDGEDRVYKELGINPNLKMGESLKNGKSRSTIQKISACFDRIQALENAALGETIQRHAGEEVDGTRIETVSKNKTLIKEIEAAMMKASSSNEGYIMWLKRGDYPDFGQSRPTVLPNPDHWKQILASSTVTTPTEEATTPALVEPLMLGSASLNDGTDDIGDLLNFEDVGIINEGIDIANSSSKIIFNRASSSQAIDKSKKTSLQSTATTRYTAFKRGALEIHAAAEMALSFLSDRVKLHPDPNISIYDATENFTKHVLTKKEERWYKSINTVDKIFDAQMARVRAMEAKPWELIELPKQTEAQRSRIAEAHAESARRYAEVEASLRRYLTRRGEGNLDPNQEILARDGNANPAPLQLGDDVLTGDFESMNVNTLRQHCKHRKMKGYSTMVKAKLIEALKKHDNTLAIRETPSASDRNASILAESIISNGISPHSDVPIVLDVSVSTPTVSPTVDPLIIINDTRVITVPSAAVDTSIIVDSFAEDVSLDQIHSIGYVELTTATSLMDSSKVLCCILECKEVAFDSCIECGKNVCKLMHGPSHSRHAHQLWKDALTNNQSFLGNSLSVSISTDSCASASGKETIIADLLVSHVPLMSECVNIEVLSIIPVIDSRESEEMRAEFGRKRIMEPDSDGIASGPSKKVCKALDKLEEAYTKVMPMISQQQYDSVYSYLHMYASYDVEFLLKLAARMSIQVSLKSSRIRKAELLELMINELKN